MSRSEGLQVALTKITGVTDKDQLDVRGPGPKRLDGFFFQCPPTDAFTVEYAHSHSDYETVNAGQFSRRGGRQLRAVTFETLFVDYGLFVVEHAPLGGPVEEDIEDLTAALVELTESGSPFLLTVAHAIPRQFRALSAAVIGPELQMPATLRTLSVSERAGEGDARYVNVSFTEYRDPVISAGRNRRKRSGGVELPLTGTITKAGVFEYTGAAGLRKVTGRNNGPVNLRQLSKWFYKTPNLARHIGKANGIPDWGGDDPIRDHARYKKGGSLTIPRALIGTVSSGVAGL